MKFFLLLNLIIFQSIHTYSQTQNILNGFRDSNWGDSITSIRLKETADKTDSISSKNFTMLVYRDKIAERSAKIYYGFSNDKLIFGSYTFLDDYTDDKSMYFKDYSMIKDLISSRYGIPAEDNWITGKNDVSLYKENPNLAGSALTLGILELKSSWKLPEGNITLNLKQENGIFIKVNYLSSSFINNFDISSVSSIENNTR